MIIANSDGGRSLRLCSQNSKNEALSLVAECVQWLSISVTDLNWLNLRLLFGCSCGDLSFLIVFGKYVVLFLLEISNFYPFWVIRLWFIERNT